MARRRVLLGALFHETNTFLDGATSLEKCEIFSGEELFAAAEDGSPLSGVLEVAAAAEWDVVPSMYLRAMPGPIVRDEAVEHFWTVVEHGLSPALDGVFVVLHGAMVSESFDDVEGEILTRIRDRVAVPICGVIDLHANATAAMAAHSDGLVAYRENPHVDARAAAMDAARLLDRLMRSGERPVTLWHHPPILWPPTGTGTSDDPVRSLEALAREIERAHEDILAVNVLPGFAFADVPDAGVSFTAVAVGDVDRARVELARLADLAMRMRQLGSPRGLSVEEAMKRVAGHSRGPIVVAEPSDNVGAGAPGDGTGLLRALVEHRIGNAAVVINDPESVAALAGKGRGAPVALCIGGKGSRLDAGPMPLEVELLSMSDGRFRVEDPKSHLVSMFGNAIDMGRCAVVRHEGVRILLTSRRTPPFDLAQLRSQGIRPESLFVIGVKAAVAHRQAFDRIATAYYALDTPGPCTSDLKSLPYRKVTRPIYPLDQQGETPVPTENVMRPGWRAERGLTSA